MSLTDLTRFPRAPFAITLAVGIGFFFGGVAMSELMRLAACPLCIIQRMLYLLLGLFSLPGLMIAGHGIGRRLAALALAAAAGTGVFVAGYQTYIQRFAPATTCSGRPTWWEDLVDRAGEMAPLLFKASGLCSDPAWKFLGLSIAEWSLACFTGLLLLALYTLLRRR